VKARFCRWQWAQGSPRAEAGSSATPHAPQKYKKDYEQR
jgi:hypothetical protein